MLYDCSKVAEVVIEVFFARNYLDVITRQQDEATSALATGLAKLFARFWEGSLDRS